MNTTPHRLRGGRLTAVAALVLVALVGCGLAIYALTHQVGPAPEAPLASAPPPTAAAGASDGGGSAPAPSGTTPSASASPSEPSRAAHPRPMSRSVPERIRIPRLGVDADVFPIGLQSDGTLAVPQQGQTDKTAWFDKSPTPGQDGPSVIEGHVTWRSEPSVFFKLGAIKDGDRISVHRKDGSTATFEVYHRARYPKNAFPTLDVYGRTAGPELRLITCGGDLDAKKHHLDNEIVFARLVSR